MTTSALSLAPIMDAGRGPSFVDLRAFVAEVEDQLRSRASDASANAYLGNRVALLSSGKASPVIALYLPVGSGSVGAMPHDEFIMVLKGRLDLVAGKQIHRLERDDAVVVPHGASFTWQAEEEVLAILLSYPDSTAGGRTITPIRKAPPLIPSGKPAPEVLLGPAPDCFNFNDYRVDEGKFVCGTWNSTAYRRKGFLYGHYEIMLLDEGSVTLSDENGRSQTFRKGDLFLAEAGSHCAWDSCETVTKIFAILRT